jgi:hypothetical protein
VGIAAGLQFGGQHPLGGCGGLGVLGSGQVQGWGSASCWDPRKFSGFT